MKGCLRFVGLLLAAMVIIWVVAFLLTFVAPSSLTQSLLASGQASYLSPTSLGGRAFLATVALGDIVVGCLALIVIGFILKGTIQLFTGDG